MSQEKSKRHAAVLERVVNVALLVAAAVFIGMLIQKYYRSSEVARDLGPPVTQGTKLSSLNLKQGEAGRVLLLALSSQCRFCFESAPLYRRIVQEVAGKGIRVVAMLPQSEDEGREYLKGMQVSVDEVRQTNLPALGIFTTPTVLLLDKEGVVDDIWVGKLSPNMEFSLLDRLRTNGQSVQPIGGDYPQILASELIGASSQKESFVVVDVDSRKEFREAHIPGSVNIPIDELETRAEDELQSAAHIVVYCRCPSDGAAVSALDQLNKIGFKNVSVLKGGLAAWANVGTTQASAEVGRNN